MWTLVLASSAVVLLSYSRNSVLAVIVAVGCSIFTPLGVDRTRRAVRIATVALAILAIGAGFAVLATQFGIFRSQVTAFETRVIGGLSDKSLAIDASVQWREIETHMALDAIAQSPIYGLGAGVFYRPAVAQEPFPDAGGRLYVHNYFLWALVKGGLLYLTLVLAVMWIGLRGLLSSTAPALVAIGCGLAGVLAAGWVAPWTAQATMAAVIGALLSTGAAQPSREPAVARSRRPEMVPTRSEARTR